MNIFVLSENPQQAAEYHCDKHVVKMILESCQILCSVFHLQNIDAPYKLTHKNHPCCIWVRQSNQNFNWLVELTSALLKEYTKRYNKIHKCSEVLNWVLNNKHKLIFSQEDLTPFAVAINQDVECRKTPNFVTMTIVEKYREYYKKDKRNFATWKTKTPEWFN